MSDDTAAFFDLDRTLISGASVMTFGYVAWRNGFMSNTQLLKDGTNALMFRMFGATDEKADEARERILSAIAGQRYDDLVALSDDIVPRLLMKVRPESQALVDRHRMAGRDTWVVTASPIEIAGPFARALGMTGAIATEAETQDGYYTGGLAEPFCYGAGKAERIEKTASQRGYDLRLCYSYSDSISDLPMLEAVGHPVAVNPDSALESLANHRGWPIVEFGRRTKRVMKVSTAVAGAAALGAVAYLVGRSQGYRAGRRAPRSWRDLLNR